LEDFQGYLAAASERSYGVCVKMGACPKVAMEKTYDWTHMRQILILKIYENGALK